MINDLDYCSLLALCFYVCAMIGLAYKDATKYLLPDGLIIIAGIAGITFHSINKWQLLSTEEILLSGVALLAAFSLFRIYSIWIVGNSHAFGKGDVKLFALSGITLGLYGSILAAISGLLIASGFAFHRSYVRNKPVRKTLIPLGVGLAPSMAVIFILLFAFPSSSPDWMRTFSQIAPHVVDKVLKGII